MKTKKVKHHLLVVCQVKKLPPVVTQMWEFLDEFPEEFYWLVLSATLTTCLFQHFGKI